MLVRTLAAVSLLALVGCAQVQTSKHIPSPEEDMQKFMASGQIGAMHSWLAEGVGRWECKNTMWMDPSQPPMESTSTAVTTMSMDGRFAVTEVTGEMPGMGTFRGEATMGYDNVAKKFVGTWVDNMGSGIMHGYGSMSPDNKRLEMVYTFNCPITGKPARMREVHTHPDANTMILESFAPNPHTGIEQQCMRMVCKRVG